MENGKDTVGGFSGGIGSWFRRFGESITKGDAAVKASLFIMGPGIWQGARL